MSLFGLGKRGEELAKGLMDLLQQPQAAQTNLLNVSPQEIERLQRAVDAGYTKDLYHGTHSSFDEIDPSKVDLGIHLGTEQQANNRLLDVRSSGRYGGGSTNFQEGANVIPLKARLGESLEMDDVGDFNSSIQVIENLLQNKQFARQSDQDLLNEMLQDAKTSLSQYGDFDAFYSSPENKGLLEEINKEIRDKGYDSIKYLNEVENSYGNSAGLNEAGMQRKQKIRDAINKLDKQIRSRMPQVPEPDNPNYKELIQKYKEAKPSAYTTAEEAQIRDDLIAESMSIDENPVYQESPYSYIALQPENVKSRFAQFKDPNNPNLLASAGALGLMSLFAPEEAEAGISKIKAFHGSPYDFDKFSTENIGTGEGAQAYGHGLYLAERRKTAESYRDALTKRDMEYEDWLADQYSNAEKNQDYGRMEMYERAMMHDLPKDFRELAKDTDYDEDYRELASQVADELEAFTKADGTKPNFGKMYEVDVDATPDELLDYDAPLQDQPKKIQNAFKEIFKDSVASDPILADIYKNVDDVDFSAMGLFDKSQGSQAYAEFAQKVGGAANLSKMLQDKGVKGIKYADAQTRFSPKGKTHNFVIFDDKLIDITRKYGIAPVMASAVLAGTMTPEQAMAMSESEARKGMSRKERRDNPASENLQAYAKDRAGRAVGEMGLGLLEGVGEGVDFLRPENLASMYFGLPQINTSAQDALQPVTGMGLLRDDEGKDTARLIGSLLSPI
jgi:hypothetical protein